MNESTSTPPAPGTRILVVDDEPNVCSAFTRALNLRGYRVDAAESGPQALEMLQEMPYDLMVLDIRMPDMDGVEVMHRVRRICSDLPIIIITGHASLESAIAAVKSDADDYLLKPVSVHQLAQAIASALKGRAEEKDGSSGPCEGDQDSESGRFLAVGRVSLDRDKRVTIVAGEGDAESLRTELTPSEAYLLTHLMQHPDSVLSCRELAQAALGYDVSEQEAKRIIRPHICRLRGKIEPDPSQPRLVRTKPGQGYFFAP